MEGDVFMLVLLLSAVLIVLVLLPCASIAHVLGLAHAGHSCAGEQKMLHVRSGENQISTVQVSQVQP